MPVVYYVLPYGPYNSEQVTANVPKYISTAKGATPEIPTESYSLINMGVEGDCLAAVNGTVSETHDPLAAKPDVIQIINRGSLGTTLTAAQATGAATKMEARLIPGDWVEEGMTFRVLLKNLSKIFLFYQYMHSKGLVEKLLGSGRDLDTRFQELPAPLQTRLQEAATEYGYGTILPGTRMRVILKRIFQEWSQSGKIIVGGEEL